MADLYQVDQGSKERQRASGLTLCPNPWDYIKYTGSGAKVDRKLNLDLGPVSVTL
jgi:hypothetical protein